ncbi:MAG: glyoxylate/hydroxypyruvate reductase A [Bacteroidetes bacterium]|nr:glyoxylate/hydroxypyruvate reductase A [Bacteroidota bacterium]
MSIAIVSPGKDPKPWLEALRQVDSSLDIQVYPQIEDLKKVEMALVWQHPPGFLRNFPHLKLISSLGAGVDHILSDSEIPHHLPIVRIVDEKLTWSMTNYVLMGVLNFHRQLYRYQKDKDNGIWDMSNPEISIKVGIMGVGALGGDVVDKLMYLGFEVCGYGLNDKKSLSFPYFAKHQLDDFLSDINVLVCMLPLTSETEGILNITLFQKCNPGTYLINVARGKHLIEEDLIPAFEEGYLSGAMLDVFRVEPLPRTHAYWSDSRIQLTPHIASVTNPKAAAPQIVENYKRLTNGLPLQHQINRVKEY